MTGPVQAATRSTYLVFAVSGFGFASWASRIPQVKQHLDLDPSALGLLLLAIAAGSVVSLPLAGTIVARWGSRRTAMAMAMLSTVSLLTVAFGYLAGVAPVAAGLFGFGVSACIWDVAMNVQGAAVERLLGRSIMSRFHAAWSLGTVTGALIGAVAVAVGVPVTAHLAVAALLEGPVVWVVARSFVADVPEVPDVTAGEDGAGAGNGGGRGAGAGSALAAWREPRTVLIGVFVLAFAFAEGSGNDWISVAVIEDYRAPATLGTLAFAVFLAAMTGGRWFGTGLIDRYGRVPVTAPWPPWLWPGWPCSSPAGPARRLRRRAAVGRRHLAGLPDRHERGRRRPGPGRPPRRRHRVHRLLRLPRRPAPDRLPRRPHRGPVRPGLRGRPPRPGHRHRPRPPPAAPPPSANEAPLPV